MYNLIANRVPAEQDPLVVSNRRKFIQMSVFI